MNDKLKRISLLEFIFLIHGAQMGIGILQLPRELAEKSGTDGWIAIIFGWLVAIAMSLIIVQLMKFFPDGTLIDLIERFIGKWAAKIGALFYAAAYALISVTIMFRSILFIKAFILPRTADYLLFLLFAIPTYLILRTNMRVLGRYSVFVFLMLLWMPFFYLFALKDSHWLYLLPVIKEGWGPILKAVPGTSLSFIGFELTFLLYPFLEKRQTASAGIIIANTLTMLVYISITVICFAFFSPEGILDTNEPTLSILKVIEFHFLERLEIIFLAFYLFVVSTTWMPYLYWTTYCTNRLFGLKESSNTPLAVFLLSIVVILMFHHPTFNENDKWQKFNSYANYLLAYAFPICLWGYLLIRRAIRGRAST